MKRTWTTTVAWALLAAGVALAQEEEAPAASQPAITINPETMSIPELLATAEQLYSLGALQQGAKLVDVVLQKDPKNVDAILLAAQAAEMRGDTHTARDYYLRVLKDVGNDFRANFGLGRAFLNSGVPRQAVAYLEQAVKLAPPQRLGEALTMLAAGYRRKGERALAIDAAERAIRESPQNFEAWQVLVAARVESGQFDRAVADSQRLVELAMSAWRTDMTQLPLLQRLEAAYEVRVATLRQYFRTLHRRNAAGGYTDELLPGREHEAAEVLTQIIQTILQQVTAQTLRTRHELVVYAQKAVEYDQRNPTTLLQYALLMREIGRYGEAEGVCARILEIDPSHSAARQQLQELTALRTSTQPADSPAPAP
jgi:tetratricopeptide (TPR) repeat protein